MALQLNEYLPPALDDPWQICTNWYHGHGDHKYFFDQMGQHITKGGGKKVGAAIGTGLGTLVGGITSAGFGTFVGMALGALLGVLFGWGAEKAFKYFCTNKKLTPKQKAFKQARELFGFSEADIRNSSIFNEKSLKKRYLKLAKKKHPDMKGGSHKAFVELRENYEVLWEVYDPDVKEKQLKSIGYYK